MKKQLLVAITTVFSILGFAQGVQFEHGTWKEVLEKAKQTNKPIFVDASASWCGACGMMKKNILPLKEVGDVYNANFICYEVDVEKGDGVEIAKKYEVSPIPAFLFIQPDGSIFYRAIGSMSAENFIAESQKALAAMNDPKPINVWDKEYADKKNDPQFLIGYIKKRNVLGMSSVSLFDEYLKLLPDAGRICPATIEIYKLEEENLRIQSFAFSYLQQNRDAFDKVSAPDKLFTDYILERGIRNSLEIAEIKKDEPLLATVIASYELQPNDVKNFYEKGFYTPFYCKDELYMEYYQRTKENDKYLKHVASMGNNYLLKMTDELIKQKDKANAQMLEDAIKSRQLDTTKIHGAQLLSMRNLTENSKRAAIVWRLNYNANVIFDQVSDKQILHDALQWSKRSIELSPYQFECQQTYINLLYKLGMKKEAIVKAKESLILVGRNKNRKEYKKMANTLQKIESGQKTWN